MTAKGVWALDRFQAGPTGSGTAGRIEQGELLVAEQVVGFKKIKFDTMENVGAGEVDLPQQEMQTSGLWLTLRPEVLAGISPDRDALVDGLRGLAYLLHHLAPLFLMCDVRDLGSWLGDAAAARSRSRGTARPTGPDHRAHAGPRLLAAEQFEPTVYLYDSQPGGVGLTERLFELIGPLLVRARETIRACSCRSGCPSCVGPVNEVGPPRQADDGHAPRPPDRLGPPRPGP